MIGVIKMKPVKLTIAAAALLTVAACGLGERNGGDTTRDSGRDSKNLSDLQAGIWVDPNGCDHWIVDDGLEGYLSPRLDRTGKPVCSGVAPPNTATGDFKAGEGISDLI